MTPLPLGTPTTAIFAFLIAWFLNPPLPHSSVSMQCFLTPPIVTLSSSSPNKRSLLITLPTDVESVECKCENNSNDKVLFLVATYVIGKEKILPKLARRFKRKIHVDARKMEVLRVLGYGENGEFIKDEKESNIHVVGWNVLGETWPYFRPNFVRMKEVMAERGGSYSRLSALFQPNGPMKSSGISLR
ncbi:hypothetical protein GLYMA_02G090266v4 [Glycine max]|nr:hypothetical protein GLYMA_02G090266v4 [Glycine max]KAH1059469.1 hypothetical protein GYH30_003468 [Glycine max]